MLKQIMSRGNIVTKGQVARSLNAGDGVLVNPDDSYEEIGV